MLPTSSDPHSVGDSSTNRTETHSEGGAMTTTQPSRADRLKRWVHFSTFRNLILDQVASSVAPITAIVTDLAECIGICDDELEGNKDYEALRDELEKIFKVLEQHYRGDVSPTITTSMESLWKDIDRELQAMKNKQERWGEPRNSSNGPQTVRTGKLKDAVDSLDDVIRCYGRVRDHLQRILLNANMSMWKIVDEFATDARLDHLQPAKSAFYNSAEASQVKRGPCTGNTRIDVLNRLVNWVETSKPGSVYWMSGMAGTGKTTISYSLCQQLQDSGRLAASFFCTRMLPECRRIEKIIPSIAYQLARFSRPFRFALSSVLVTDPDAHARLPNVQFEALIVKPLLKITVKNTSPANPPGENMGPENASTQVKAPKAHSAMDTLPENLVFVIDALDECENKKDTRQLLELLMSKSQSLPIKFVVSSRPEPEIRDPMIQQKDQDKSRVVLHELDQRSVKTDIESYLREALAPMQPKPTEDQILALVERAGTLFISAATIVRYISFDNFQGNPHDRLENVLNASSGSTKKHKDIDELYTSVLEGALDNPDLEDTEIEDRKQVLYTVICAKEPLTVAAISKLLKMKHADRVHAALRPLWSVLHVSSASGLVTTFHASFPDYMLSASRSKQYHCDPQVHNHTLAMGCFDCFRNMHPQFNICGLESSFVRDADVPGLNWRVKDVIKTEISYAARYWAAHVNSAIRSNDLLHDLEEFLSVRLLLWMEVMNLKGWGKSMPQAIQPALEYPMDSSDSLRALILDALQFVGACMGSHVLESTVHIYTSLLPFWPSSSSISRLYVRRTRGMIKLNGTAIAQQQHAPIITQNLGSNSATFSPNGTQIALAAGNEVVLLDALTGLEKYPRLTGHQKAVESVQFSPDGTHIVSGSSDTTIRVWNTRSGEPLLQSALLERHIHCVLSVAFSPDGSQIVSGSYDEPICIWDACGGKLLSQWHTTPNCNDLIRMVKYSLDGRHVISVGQNSGIVVWYSKDGRALKTIRQHEIDCQIYAADISPDGTYVAYAHYDEGIYVWDIRTGKVIRLTHHNTSRSPGITSLFFSHDGSKIVSGSDDKTVCIWDAQNGNLVLGPLVGHTDGLTSIALSPDDTHIVSTSENTLCLWDTRSVHTPPKMLHGHETTIKSINISYDGTRIISSSKDGTVCAWDTESGELLCGLTKKNFARGKRPSSEQGYARIEWVGFSPDATRIIANTDHGPFIFDAETGSPCSLYATSSPSPRLFLIVPALAFMVLGMPLGSPELKSTHGFVVLLLLPVLVCALLHKFYGCAISSHRFRAIGFQAPVNWLHAVVSRVNQYSNMATRFSTFRDTVFGRVDITTPSIVWADFSPDGTRIVSCLSDGTIRVHNAQTNRLILVTCLLNASESGCNIERLSFSSNGYYIFSKVKYRKPQMHDANNGELLVNLDDPEWQDIKNCDPSFSPDGTRIIVNHPTSISLIDLASGVKVQFPNTRLPGEEKIYKPVLVHLMADGSRMVSTLTGGSTCIWDVHTGELLLRLPKTQLDPVNAVVLSPCGRYLITGSDKGSIRITDIQNSQLRASEQASNSIGWEVTDDGWVLDKQSRPLVWVPPRLQSSLMWPWTKRLISKEGYLELDFTNAYLGESWAKCYQPS